MQANWEIGTRSVAVVVGTNPEMADIDNPCGEIVRDCWFILAEDSMGNRRQLGGVMFEDQDEAARFAATLDGQSPEAADWAKVEPRYGSPAYEGVEPELAWLERQADESDYHGQF